MLKMETKKILLLTIIIIFCACKENKIIKHENKQIIKDVLLSRTAYSGKNRVDSIVIEYTDIDSITQFVRRKSYINTLKDSFVIDYKLINCKTRAYIELPDDTTKSAYLDTENSDIIARSFNFAGSSFPESVFNFSGNFEYINYFKDSINNTSYYVFKGNDIGFNFTTDGYCYFDSIFHLKKIYYKDILIYSVN